MKNLQSLAFVLLTGTMLLVSCKKKEPTFYSSHVFWWDEATKDSLVKSGNHYLMAMYDYSPGNGESGFNSVADSLSFFASFPGCDAKNVVFVKLLLKKGEKKKIAYKICKAEKSESTVTTNNTAVNHWQGEITFQEGQCANTQLKW